MTRFLALIVLALSTVPAYGMPLFLELYRKDPFRNPAVDGCNTCHMSPQGGDARNAFGQAFESAGEMITPMLRAQFPDRFIYPTSRVSDALIIHFSDPDRNLVVVESGGTKNLVDADKTAVNGTPAGRATASQESIKVATGQLQASSDVPVDEYAREGAFFGNTIVNLPNGKPQKKGGIDFFIGHRFGQDISNAGLAGLFGFDSGATVAYGVRIGLTDRLSIGVGRSNDVSAGREKPISIGSAFQVSRQSLTMPFTLQLRGGVDGFDNFGLYDKDDNPVERFYSPWIHVVATRTFKDRFSMSFIPIFTFNTRDEERLAIADPQAFIGANHNNTISLGIGLGYRFRPTVSIVGEYIPRLWGFKSNSNDIYGKDQERLSVGLQKSTYRHTFELTVSRQEPMTPAQFAFRGTDTFQIGFNIYRRLR